ncbi:MAG: hypothetical protein JXA74_11870 [Anaerolineae bacterium]|nr:hypothetical protein [Anaerolineae bacterium]
MGAGWSLEGIEAWRDLRYHRTAELRVTSEAEARAFVDEIGFCFLFGDKSVEIPTLWAAVCGSRRPVPHHHNDPDLGRTWQWKDTLPSRREIYYGKLLRGKPTLVSLALLPIFYALSPNYGDLEDYLIQYEEGLLSAEAKGIYEALLYKGAMATSRLRQEAGLPGGGANARRFESALTELQMELKIVKVGISDANRWGYAYVYDLFLRRFPEVPEAARAISTDAAMETLLVRYLRNVVAQTQAGVKRVFGWDEWEWERLLDRLTEKGLIRRDLRIEGLRGPCLALAEEPALWDS